MEEIFWLLKFLSVSKYLFIHFYKKMTLNDIKHVNLYFSGKYIPSAFPFGVLHKYQGKKRIISYLHIGCAI